MPASKSDLRSIFGGDVRIGGKLDKMIQEIERRTQVTTGPAATFSGKSMIEGRPYSTFDGYAFAVRHHVKYEIEDLTSLHFTNESAEKEIEKITKNKDYAKTFDEKNQRFVWTRSDSQYWVEKHEVRL